MENQFKNCEGCICYKFITGKDYIEEKNDKEIYYCPFYPNGIDDDIVNNEKECRRKINEV